MTDTSGVTGMKAGVLARGITLLSRSAILRYLFAILIVAIAVLLHRLLTMAVGGGLPAYITFYPAIMIAAMLAGFWPGMLTTMLSALYALIWLVPPYGVFAISRPVDAVGLALFFGIGALMSGVAFLYHRTREQATAELEARNEALRRSEERFRLMIESVKDYAIIMLDPQGLVTSWNVGAERIKGYRAEEILGTSFTVFYTPEDIAAGKPRHDWNRRWPTDASKTKAGACGKTARAFGPVWL